MVIWTPRAKNDLKAIHDYIAQDSPLTAKRLVRELIQKTDHLLTAPYIGKKVPELDQQELREIGRHSWELSTKFGLVKSLSSQSFINAAISKLQISR